MEEMHSERFSHIPLDPEPYLRWRSYYSTVQSTQTISTGGADWKSARLYTAYPENCHLVSTNRAPDTTMIRVPCREN